MPETKQLYHFLPAKFAIEAIEKRRLKAADLDQANDPFESLVVAFNSREQEYIFLDYRKVVLGRYGMVCFSQSYQDPLLWGHYADSLKGICLGFYAVLYNDDTRDVIKKVKYVPQRIDARAFNILMSWIAGNRDPLLLDKVQSQIKALMHTKSWNWEYESEWRSWIRKEYQDPVSNLFFFTLDNIRLKLREILIGFRCMEEDMKPKLDELVSRYPDPPKILYTQASLRHFAIEIRRCGPVS